MDSANCPVIYGRKFREAPLQLLSASQGVLFKKCDTFTPEIKYVMIVNDRLLLVIIVGQIIMAYYIKASNTRGLS